MRRKIELLMGLLMLVFVVLISNNLTKIMNDERVVSVSAKEETTRSLHEETKMAEEKHYVVVLDAGHGGADGGKVGVNQVLEKDINLAIVKKLKQFLESEGVEVVLTRKDENGLYSEEDAHKKQADMLKRVEIANEAVPDAVVSIHQNSYQTPDVKGPQVFYYQASSSGKEMALILQKSFDRVIGDENRRKIKPNKEYYLLLHMKAPTVIVECGFLSNPEEAQKLADEEYQSRIAFELHVGIMAYLNAR